MLGRRRAQGGLFDAANLLGADQVREIPFYGRLAATWREIFRDEQFAELYADKGRRSIPPSILATATVLQRFENLSDEEVVERTKYDLRWKAVFDTDPCSLQPLFAKSSLQLFRLRLVLNEKQGLIFDAVLAEARRRGLLPKELQVALDSSPVRGRGAVKDAYNLLSDAIGRVIRAVATAVEKDPSEVARSRGLERHLQRGSVKGSRVVDWDDPESVRAFLAELVDDCRSALEAANEAGAATAETALLAKVLAENVEGTPSGPQIPQKVPKGRTTSVHDSEMRHGHKSTGKLYTGHKAHVGVDTGSKFLTAIEMSEPSSAEGQHVGSLIEQSEDRTKASVVEALGDCAYGTSTAQAQAAEAEVPLVTKMPSPPKGRFGPRDFVVSEDGKAAQCPAGHSSAKVGRSNDDVVHRWSPEQCGPCPLRDRCLRGNAQQRSLRVASDFHDRRRREAYAHSPEGREKLRLRTLIEHAIGYMKNLGAGSARYTGRAKTLFQWFACGAVVNLRRLWQALPAPVAVLLVALLPLLLAASAAPAQAAPAGPETRHAAVTHDRTGAARPPRAPVAVSGGAVPPAARLDSTPAAGGRAVTVAALPSSRRRLLRPPSPARGPPRREAFAAMGVISVPRGGAAGRPLQRSVVLARVSGPARSSSALSDPRRSQRGLRTRGSWERSLRTSHWPRRLPGLVSRRPRDPRAERRIRPGIAGTRRVRRPGRSCGCRPGLATGGPRAPPVIRVGNS